MDECPSTRLRLAGLELTAAWTDMIDSFTMTLLSFIPSFHLYTRLHYYKKKDGGETAGQMMNEVMAWHGGHGI